MKLDINGFVVQDRQKATNGKGKTMAKQAVKAEAKIDVDAAFAGIAEKKAKVAETVAKRKAKQAAKEAKIDVDAAFAGIAEKKAKQAETVAKRKAKLAALAGMPSETQRVIQQLDIFAKQVGRKRGLSDIHRDRVLARALEKGLSSCTLDDVYGSYKEIKAEIAALPKTSSRKEGAAAVNRADILAFAKSERGSVALNATVRHVLKAAYCRTGKGGKDAAAKLAAEFDAVFA